MSPLKSYLNSAKRIQNEKGVCITSIKRDHGGEIENENFHLFYEEKGILHNFSIPRTQKHVIVERNQALLS